MTEDRHYRIPRVLKDEDDLNPSNPTSTTTFQQIADIRFSRRAALKGLLATSALTAVGTALAPLNKAAAATDFAPGKLTADAQAQQFGYNCDFIAYMPLPAGSDNSENGLLFVNHEYTNPHMMFPGFADAKAAAAGTTADSTAIELEAHGASVVEIKKDGGVWKAEADDITGEDFELHVDAGTGRIIHVEDD